jgi:hypothetical protein
MFKGHIVEIIPHRPCPAEAVKNGIIFLALCMAECNGMQR